LFLETLWRKVVMEVDMSIPFVVDFGGTGTRVEAGGGIQAFHKTFSSGSRAEVLEFVRALVPPKTPVVVLVFPAPVVRQGGVPFISPLATKFGYLAGPIPALEEEFSRGLGCPVLVSQDGLVTSSGTLAAGDVGPEEVVYVVMAGTSLSGCLLYRGRPSEGPFTPQFSHLTLDPGGPPCPGKGHRGCVKMFLGAAALSARAVGMGLPGDLAEVTKLGIQGDQRAIEFYAATAERFAHALSQVANPVPLDAIVLGGGIARGAGELLLGPLRAAFVRGQYMDPNLAAAIDLRLTKSPNLVIDGARYLAAQFLSSRSAPFSRGAFLPTVAPALRRVTAAPDKHFEMLEWALEPIGPERAAKLLPALRRLLMLVYRDYHAARAGNPPDHHLFVLRHIMIIAAGERFSDAELWRVAAIAMLHDVSNVEKITKGMVAELRQIDPNAAAALEVRRKSNRTLHMREGSSKAQRMLLELNESLGEAVSSAEDIEAICDVIRIHDNPSLDIPIPGSNRLAVAFREADRLWMVTIRGVRCDVIRKGKNPEDRELFHNQIDENLTRYREERLFYSDSEGPFTVEGMFFRTATGGRLLRDLLNEIEAQLGIAVSAPPGI
jgi:predicted NBD/HSP70 family sugar kinase